MSVAFPALKIVDPIRHAGLSVFPLLGEGSPEVPYDLAHEALARGTVVVREVSEGGTVPELLVENSGELRVLFIEGEQLIGAKQDRVLNTSVLVPARSRTRIPVSCVERGRWNYKTRHFGSYGAHSPSPLREVLKSSVYRSIKAKRGHRADQGKVWDEVSRQQHALRAASSSSAMFDTFEANRERVEEFRRRLAYTKGAVGVAVGLGDRLVTVDVFDKPATCGKVWNRLLSGMALDVIERSGLESQVEAESVDSTLRSLDRLSWDRAEPVGEGEDFRTQSPAGDYASALVFGRTLIHGSVVCMR